MVRIDGSGCKWLDCEAAPVEDSLWCDEHSRPPFDEREVPLWVKTAIASVGLNLLSQLIWEAGQHLYRASIIPAFDLPKTEKECVDVVRMILDVRSGPGARNALEGVMRGSKVRADATAAYNQRQNEEEDDDPS